MKSKFSLVGILAIVALSFLAMPVAQAQVKYFKGLTNGALVKSANNGEAAEATTGTATSTAAAATINADSGKVTTESLTTAPQAVYTFTLTNSKITAASKVFVSFTTSGTGLPFVSSVAPGSGTCVIKIGNAATAGGASFNATGLLSFFTVQ